MDHVIFCQLDVIVSKLIGDSYHLKYIMLRDFIQLIGFSNNLHQDTLKIRFAHQSPVIFEIS